MHGTTVAKLAYYDQACVSLSKARTIDEVSAINNEAVGMQAYARQAKNKQLEIDAGEIRFRAARRIGQLITLQKTTVGLAKPGPRKKDRGKNSPDLPTLLDAGIDKDLAKLSRKMAKLSDADFDARLAERRETIEAANAKVAVNLLGSGAKPRGTQGTGENEWYTPADIISDVRKVLGVIDLDPASSEQAQRNVQALQYLTLADGGLMRMWHGNVWLNPPYAQPHIESFADKMILEVRSCRVTSAIMLTHNYTDTAWFQKLAAVATAICFPKGRIRFEAPDGTLAAPTQGQALFGVDPIKFIDVFAPMGFVVGAPR
jgi:phage N-6-adenine-methyltransferase